MSEPVKKADYDLEDVEANKLAEEQKKAAELAPQTESIYTRNKEVWKATNGDILEDHLVKEGLPFSKDSVDTAHARYVAELQAAEEAKAKEEARKEAERKATETAANPSTNPPTTSPTTANPPTTSSKPLDEETKLLLALAPRMIEVITEMWDKAAMSHGWVFVSQAVENRFGNPFGNLSKEVYAAYTSSKGSEEVLQQLIKQHTPHQIAPQNPQTTPQPTTITPEGPNSSTNQAPQPNKGAEGVTQGVTDVVTGGVVDVFERNMKLTDEEVIIL